MLVKKRKRYFALSVLFLVVLCCCWRNLTGFSEILFLSSIYYFEADKLEATAVEVDLHLKIPFYVYEDDLNWMNATFDRREFLERSFSISGYKKHSDDYWLLAAAMKHPMRTKNPSDAKLFFVPTLLNVLSVISFNGEKRKLCVTPKKCFDSSMKKWEVLGFADDLLGESQYFQRSKGADHVIVASHFTSRIFADLPNIQSCHQFIFETKVTGSMSGLAEEVKHNNQETPRLRIPSMYIGNACPRTSRKTHDFALIAQMLEDEPSNHRYPLFQSRRNVCEWLSRGNFSTSHCGSGVPQCPHLSNARYGFHVRGDSWGSNRLMDTLLSGTVPLFTDEEQYKILPDILPWRDLSYLVNVTSFEAFQESLQHLLHMPESFYQEKLKLIQRHQPILDHENIYQFDRLMAFLAKNLGLG